MQRWLDNIKTQNFGSGNDGSQHLLGLTPWPHAQFLHLAEVINLLNPGQILQNSHAPCCTHTDRVRSIFISSTSFLKTHKTS